MKISVKQFFVATTRKNFVRCYDKHCVHEKQAQVIRNKKTSLEKLNIKKKIEMYFLDLKSFL